MSVRADKHQRILAELLTRPGNGGRLSFPADTLLIYPEFLKTYVLIAEPERLGKLFLLDAWQFFWLIRSRWSSWNIGIFVW